MLQIIILFICFSHIFSADLIVNLPNGKIRGQEAVTMTNNITFYAYMGIPFAAPPVGTLRFQPPQTVENWTGVKNTTSFNTSCYQITTTTIDGQSEDCLYINVYTRALPTEIDKNLPVVVTIYGGSFTHGSAWGDTVAPQHYIENDIVVVSFNYRIGPFGFLSTGDTVISGNMGLKDQLFALKWVRQNIHLFGGDPEKITISGQNSGAASVSYHVLSPASSGLFRGAIAISGSALSAWAHSRNPRDVAYGIAGLINSNFSMDSSSEELLDFLQKVSAEDIHQTMSKYLTFGPVIEPEHDQAFITKNMYELVSSGNFNQVPLLAGIMSEEELSKGGDILAWKSTMTNYDHNPERLCPYSMNINDSTTKKLVGEKIMNIYSDTVFSVDLGAGIRWMSDEQFSRANIRCAQLQAKYTQVWFYQFSYRGEMGRNYILYPGCGRVENGEDSNYLATQTDLSTYPESDITTMKRYVAIMANFVKYLNPTPEIDTLFQNITWPKVTSDNFYYLDIDTDLSIKANPKEDFFSQWVELFDQYAQPPYISY